ncbi:unnamed protein product [Nesidiocoris tenuis]|uniref:Uncharacterized protein n=1 Tax=Nesidiocoris tenuis TaxID=355587 RepID=A0A6H5G5W2_9HEMI|nr:unnamed protein product [Nesidiocoris tenuis]
MADTNVTHDALFFPNIFLKSVAGHGESGGPRVGEQTSEPSGAEQSKRAFQPYPQGPPYQPHHPSPMDKGSTPYNPYHVDKPSGAYDAEKVLLRPPHQPQLQHQHQSQHQGQMHQSHPAEQAHPEQHPEQLRHPRHEHEAKHQYHHRASQPPHQQLPQQHQSMPQHQAPAPHQAPLEEERYRGDKPPMYHPPNRLNDPTENLPFCYTRYSLPKLGIKCFTKEENSVEADPDHEDLRIIARRPQQLELVQHDGDELQLQVKYFLNKLKFRISNDNLSVKYSEI